MVEQGGAQVSPIETGAEGGGDGLSSGQPPEAEGVERESECGVWCGGKCGFVLSRTVLGCLFTHWLRITISG